MSISFISGANKKMVEVFVRGNGKIMERGKGNCMKANGNNGGS